jgi:hypothetical protein
MFCCVLFSVGCDKIFNDSSTSNWEQLGKSFESIIYNVISDKDGKIYVSGGDIGNVSVWDGANWSQLGNASETFSGGVYWPITIDNAGNVFAVGRIRVPQANSTYNVAKWNKSTNTWINLTSDKVLFDNGIDAIATDANGNLYVAGKAQHIAGIESGAYIYKWNGSTWNILGAKMLAGSEILLYIDKLNNIYCSFGINDNASPYIAKWNGTSWDELGGKNSANFGIGYLLCINSDSQGNVYAGGYFTDGSKAYNIYKWTKASNKTSAMYTHGNSLEANSIAFDSADTLYVAGDFTNSIDKRYIAKYHLDRDQWSDYWNLNANGKIKSICFDKNGNMYAGGEFTNSEKKYYVAVYKKK